MAKKWHAYELTQEQIDQAKRVEDTLCNELNLLAREGVPVPILLSALGTVIADLLTCQTGPQSVAPWFARQADLIASLQGKAN